MGWRNTDRQKGKSPRKLCTQTHLTLTSGAEVSQDKKKADVTYQIFTVGFLQTKNHNIYIYKITQNLVGSSSISEFQ